MKMSGPSSAAYVYEGQSEKVSITSSGRRLEAPVGEVETYCFSGSGFGRYYDFSQIYEGMIVNGLKNGYGRVIYYTEVGDTSVYKGNFKDGQINGVGTYSY